MTSAPLRYTVHNGRIGIVGLGLIGGSFARAFSRSGITVYGCDRLEDVVVSAAHDIGLLPLTDELVGTCELIILAGYPEAMIAWVREHAAHCSPQAILMDTAGVKRSVCAEIHSILSELPQAPHFIGAHPMAGTHHSGWNASRPDLFDGAPLVVIQGPSMSHTQAIERLKELLKPCRFGSFTLADAPTHDRAIAFSSQLAHVLSNAYVKSPQAQTHHGFSAGSYLDLTRVAELNATMWTELFLENHDMLIDELNILIHHLKEYREALKNNDRDTLWKLLKEGSDCKIKADCHDE